MEFEAAGDVIGVLETEFRRDERVIRFLTTVMDKFHLEYSESRRNKLKEKKAASKEA
jgi:small subunit ribosomal protein S6